MPLSRERKRVAVDGLEQHLASLNDAQARAVCSAAQHTLVLAGPGSGKTRVITTRVAYLIGHRHYDPRHIMVVTFTNKASNDLRMRLGALVGPHNTTIGGTFHSLAARYLRKYGHHVGVSQSFVVADQDHANSVVKDILAEQAPTGEDCAKPHQVTARISKLKARSRDVMTDGSVSDEFRCVYSAYEARLRADNALDFDDLIIKFSELAHTFPQCLRDVRHVLVDEFQDTNAAQYELLLRLVQQQHPHRVELTVVGDPDQSIYGFRAANAHNISDLQAALKSIEVHTLGQNYRSTGAIVAASRLLIEQEGSRLDKNLSSQNPECTPVVLRHLPTDRLEAKWIATEISRLCRSLPCLALRSFAILLRMASLSPPIEMELQARRIAYRVVGGPKFVAREEVRDVVAYLRAAVFADGPSVIRSVNVPTRGVGGKSLARVKALAAQEGVPLLEACRRAAVGSEDLRGPARAGLEAYVKCIDRMVELRRGGAGVADLVAFILQQIGYAEHLQLKYKDDSASRLDNVQQLLARARTYEAEEDEGAVGWDELPDVAGVEGRASGDSLTRFLQDMALAAEAGDEGGESDDHVTISTIHGAKGLEWPVVFVPQVVKGVFPHYRIEMENGDDGGGSEEEERRLLFVAMTRAQVLLCLSWARQRTQRAYAEATRLEPSKFLPRAYRFSQTGPVTNGKIYADMLTVLGLVSSNEAIALTMDEFATQPGFAPSTRPSCHVIDVDEETLGQEKAAAPSLPQRAMARLPLRPTLLSNQPSARPLRLPPGKHEGGRTFKRLKPLVLD